MQGEAAGVGCDREIPWKGDRLGALDPWSRSSVHRRPGTRGDSHCPQLCEPGVQKWGWPWPVVPEDRTEPGYTLQRLRSAKGQEDTGLSPQPGQMGLDKGRLPFLGSCCLCFSVDKLGPQPDHPAPEPAVPPGHPWQGRRLPLPPASLGRATSHIISNTLRCPTFYGKHCSKNV